MIPALKRRPPIDVVRYVLRKLERIAIDAGQHPVLIHEALEALDKIPTDRERPTKLSDLHDESCIRLAIRERELEQALRAADSIMWMAEQYAEAGGTHGPEMRDYKLVKSIIDTALADKLPACGGCGSETCSCVR